MTMATSHFRYILNTFLISLVVPLTICRLCEGGHPDEHEFTYGMNDAQGPNSWGTLKPEWKTCGIGKVQSPIDFVNVNVEPSLGPLGTTYKAAPAKIESHSHHVSVEWEGDAGSLNINGKDYKLSRMHWHSPSEHTVNGKSFDLEGHAIHISADSSIAVIGVLYNIGQPDPFLSKVLGNSKEITTEGTHLASINPDDIMFNKNSYYRYMGSLTTPPCTEGLTWSVIKEVKTVSVEQVNTLKASIHVPTNARPVQNLQGRTVQASS